MKRTFDVNQVANPANCARAVRLWSRPCVASGHEFAHVHPHGTQGLLHPTALRVSDVKHHENVEKPRSRREIPAAFLFLGTRLGGTHMYAINDNQELETPQPVAPAARVVGQGPLQRRRRAR